MTITVDEANAYLIDNIQWEGLSQNEKALYVSMSSEILNNKYRLETRDTHKMAIARYALFLMDSALEPGMTKSSSIGGANVVYDYKTGDLPMIVQGLLAGARLKQSPMQSPQWN